MKKGATRYSNLGNRAILWHLERCNKTTRDLERLLGKSSSTLKKYMKEPYLLTVKQLYLLSGMFDIPFIELVYAIHLNRFEPEEKGKTYLYDTMVRVQSSYGLFGSAGK